MIIYIQWATATVNDWVQYDITGVSQIRALPKKPVPSDSPVIDDNLGWIAAVNIQGIVFTGDHIGFDYAQGNLIVGKWNDDVADWPFLTPGDGFGALYTIGPTAPDPNLPVTPEYAAANPTACGQIGGNWFLINTNQTFVRYANLADLQAALVQDPVENAWVQEWIDDPNRLEWSAWPRFNNNNIIHGVWLDNTQWAALSAARSHHGWQEWING